MRMPEDEFTEFSRIKLPFPFSKIFERLTKDMAQELDKLWEDDLGEKMIKRGGISISISNEDGTPRIRIGEMGNPASRKSKTVIKRKISKEDAERYAKLPREEAKSNVKRLSDRVVYEILLPGVKNIKDIFVHKLQNSIEIKAFGKDKAYFKLIPVDMNVERYGLKDEMLILELKE